MNKRFWNRQLKGNNLWPASRYGWLSCVRFQDPKIFQKKFRVTIFWGLHLSRAPARTSRLQQCSAGKGEKGGGTFRDFSKRCTSDDQPSTLSRKILQRISVEFMEATHLDGVRWTDQLKLQAHRAVGKLERTARFLEVHKWWMTKMATTWPLTTLDGQQTVCSNSVGRPGCDRDGTHIPHMPVLLIPGQQQQRELWVNWVFDVWKQCWTANRLGWSPPSLGAECKCRPLSLQSGFVME